MKFADSPFGEDGPGGVVLRCRRCTDPVARSILDGSWAHTTDEVKLRGGKLTIKHDHEPELDVIDLKEVNGRWQRTEILTYSLEQTPVDSPLTESSSIDTSRPSNKSNPFFRRERT